MIMEQINREVRDMDRKDLIEYYTDRRVDELWDVYAEKYSLEGDNWSELQE